MALIDRLSEVSESVFAFQECDTLFPDGNLSSQFSKSEVMSRYLEKMSMAQDQVFQNPRIPRRGNVISFPMIFGDLNRIDINKFPEAKSADFFVVFGASFIKGALCNFLVKNGALNIHMGVSPYYRGSSCNFWAMYNGDYQYMGATIHELSKGLDSGPILRTVFPEAEKIDPFVLTMKSVRSAQNALANYLTELSVDSSKRLIATNQSREKELHYTKAEDFTDDVARKYLEGPPAEEAVYVAMSCREMDLFVNPVVCS